MALQTGRHEVTYKRVLYDLPGTDRVTIRTGIEYATSDAGPHTLNLFYPPDRTSASSTPAVLFTNGLSDPGAHQIIGCRISEMESFISWGRLVAASGAVGITYTTGADPVADARAVRAFLRSEGRDLGVDAARIAMWACSSHLPNALAQLIEDPGFFRGAVLCYGFMLEFDDSLSRLESQKAWRYVNPIAGKTIDDMPADIPLFVVRAGRDAVPGINDSIDRFLPQAVKRNLPVTFVNHHTGPHGFELDDDSPTSREIVKQLLTFLLSKVQQ